MSRFSAVRWSTFSESDHGYRVNPSGSRNLESDSGPMKSLTQWIGLALLVDMVWIYLLFLLRYTKWFMTAWVFGALVTGAGVLCCGYTLLIVISFSSMAGEAALHGVGALTGFGLSLPFVLLAFVYVRVYRRYREERPR